MATLGIIALCFATGVVGAALGSVLLAYTLFKDWSYKR